MNRPNGSGWQALLSRERYKPLSRRGLFSAAASGVASLVVPRHVLGGPGYQAPSDTLNIAGVGVGGMGRRYLRGCNSENVVALCDVDHDFAARVFRTYPKAAVYRDFREMEADPITHVGGVCRVAVPPFPNDALAVRLTLQAE